MILLVSLGDAASLFSGGLLARPSNSNVNHCTYTRAFSCEREGTLAGTLTSSLSWTLVRTPCTFCVGTTKPLEAREVAAVGGRGIMWDAAQLDNSMVITMPFGLDRTSKSSGANPVAFSRSFDTNWKPAEDDQPTFSRLIQDDIDTNFAQEFHGDIARKKEVSQDVAVGRLSVARCRSADRRADAGAIHADPSQS